MMPPFSNVLEQSAWLIKEFPASTPMTGLVNQTGWRRSHITMLLRLHSLSPEIHSLIRRGVLNEKQIKRLTNVVRTVQRERILREMLCE